MQRITSWFFLLLLCIFIVWWLVLHNRGTIMQTPKLVHKSLTKRQHLQIFKVQRGDHSTAYRRVRKVMLVLEEGVETLPGIKKRLYTILQKLPNDWDMVQLCEDNRQIWDAELQLAKEGTIPTQSHAVLVGNEDYRCSRAYLVSASGARKLLTAQTDISDPEMDQSLTSAGIFDFKEFFADPALVH